MADRGTARVEGRDGSSGAGQGLKMKASQRAQELRNIALQEKGRKFFAQPRQERLLQKREQLSRLPEAVQEDIRTLNVAQKPKTAISCPHFRLTVSKADGAEKHPGSPLARRTVEVAQEKLQAEIYRQVNKCNLLQYQVRQRIQARDHLQRQLQQLQDAWVDDNRTQLQVIRQLDNSIEKVRMKVHAAQKVTSLYVAVRDALKKDLAHLPGRLDPLHEKAKLCRKELQGMQLRASDAIKAAKVAKEDMAEMEAKFLTAKEFRYRSLAAHKVSINRRWLKEARERAQVEKKLEVQSLKSQDPLADDEMKAAESQLDKNKSITEKVEKIKNVAQCSSVSDIPRGLLLHQKRSADMERYIQECKAKKAAKMEMLTELELKRDELKFHQLHSANRSKALEEEMKMRLQSEEARLEQRRADVKRLQVLLSDFEDGVDNLLARLRGITVPGQDNSAKPKGTEEKLQHCQRKLQHLVQRVANLPSDSQSTDEDKKIFGKVQDLLERTTANRPQKKISLEDSCSSIHDPFELSDKDDDDVVLTRENIKKQGLKLIQKKKKSYHKK